MQTFLNVSIADISGKPLRALGMDVLLSFGGDRDAN